MDLSQSFKSRLIAKLKQGNFKPLPRWRFILRRLFFWLGSIIALLISSLSVAVMIYLARFDDLKFYGAAGKGPLGVLFLLLPYFWIIFLAGFIFIVYYNIKKTDKGYRYPVWLIIVVSIFTSFIFGSLFSVLDLGERIDDALGRRAPFYDKVFNPRVDFWSHPAEGRLSGLVVSEPRDGRFHLIDRNRQKWTILFSERDNHSGRGDISVGRPAALIGRQLSDDSFAAEKIAPLHPGRGFFDERSRERLLPPPMVNVGEIWQRHPELKADFISGLIDNATNTKEIIKTDSDFKEWLQSLDLDENTIKTLGL